MPEFDGSFELGVCIFFKSATFNRLFSKQYFITIQTTIANRFSLELQSEKITNKNQPI